MATLTSKLRDMWNMESSTSVDEEVGAQPLSLLCENLPFLVILQPHCFSNSCVKTNVLIYTKLMGNILQVMKYLLSSTVCPVPHGVGQT